MQYLLSPDSNKSYLSFPAASFQWSNESLPLHLPCVGLLSLDISSYLCLSLHPLWLSQYCWCLSRLFFKRSVMCFMRSATLALDGPFLYVRAIIVITRLHIYVSDNCNPSYYSSNDEKMMKSKWEKCTVKAALTDTFSSHEFSHICKLINKIHKVIFSKVARKWS